MKNLTLFNTKLGLRWNRFIRRLIYIPNKRKELINTDFTLLCNNCTGGLICHDLGLQFRSPTINLFFYSDHFIRFCENLDYYLHQELIPCKSPLHSPEIEYPVWSLGDLELHFLHYNSFDEAKSAWDRRVARINKNNLFIMWTFFDKTDESLLQRFEKLPYPNKVAFTEKPFPQYSSAFHISGYPDGLGLLTAFDRLNGTQKIDQFDYVAWFNQGK